MYLSGSHQPWKRFGCFFGLQLQFKNLGKQKLSGAGEGWSRRYFCRTLIGCFFFTAVFGEWKFFLWRKPVRMTQSPPLAPPDPKNPLDSSRVSSLMRFDIPVGGRGAVRIISQKEIRHYRIAGVAIAAGAERKWSHRERQNLYMISPMQKFRISRNGWCCLRSEQTNGFSTRIYRYKIILPDYNAGYESKKYGKSIIIFIHWSFQKYGFAISRQKFY